jgi:Icc-related predicted phosphoesterase
MTTRIVALSDTHCMHDKIAVPTGDVLVHAGDFCGRGSEGEAGAFADWIVEQPHPHKVVIAGNHDRCLESDLSLAARLFVERGITYLFDSGATVAGLRFYGSPWQPWFLSWAFNLPRGEALRAKWDMIDQNLDVLITHGPPQGILDRTDAGDAAGCADLVDAIARVRPRLHLFGHIHEGYGARLIDGTLHVNASNCTAAYRPTNPPIVIDISATSCDIA